MGSFENLHLGAVVEVLRGNGDLIKGKIAWKGVIVNKPGSWVGLELDLPIGSHDGILESRRYFQCRRNCGLFARPGKVRFSQNNIRNRSRNSYKSVPSINQQAKVTQKNADSDTVLKNQKGRPGSFARIPSDAITETLQIIYGYEEFNYGQKPGYHLSHCVGRKLKPSKKEILQANRSYQTARTFKIANINNSGYYYVQETNNGNKHFRSPPSVPVTDRRLCQTM